MVGETIAIIDAYSEKMVLGTLSAFLLVPGHSDLARAPSLDRA